jgi:hypothetical protein
LTLFLKTLLDPRKPDAWTQWENNELWTWFPSRKVYNQGFDRRLYDIGLSIYLLVGADVDFSIVELVDFLAGLVTLDPVGDDKGGKSEEEAED